MLRRTTMSVYKKPQELDFVGPFSKVVIYTKLEIAIINSSRKIDFMAPIKPNRQFPIAARLGNEP